MFIRRKRNRSGSYSVQIIQKIGRNNKLVKSIGVGRTEKELSLLETIARFELDKLRGLGSLFDEREDLIIESFVSTLYNEDITLQGPELVFGKLFEHIGLEVVLGGHSYFRSLVISRIAMPGSKLKTVEYLQRHAKIDIGVHAIYKFLDRIDSKVIHQIQSVVFEYTKQILNGSLGLVFYDMTTLYFEAEKEDDLRRIGYSKDGKHQHPQIMIGLLVTTNGYPVSYQIFEGNTAETKTLIPAIESLCSRFKITKPTIVADAALLSKKNINKLEELEYKYILGGRVKSEMQSIRNQIIEAKITEQSPQEFWTEKGRLIVSFSKKRQKKDEYNRKRGLMKLEKKLKTGKLTKESINNRGYNKYLKLEGETIITIDYEKYKLDSQWDGLKGYNTNTNLSPEDIISNYSNLWTVEKAFRISKTDLKVRPIYHRKKSRIEAHISICFCAYTIYKELERRIEQSDMQISVEQAIEQVKDILQISYKLPKSLRQKTKLLQLTETKIKLLHLVR